MTATLSRDVLAFLPVAAEVLAAEQQRNHPRWQPRKNQEPPEGDWRVWLLLAGRGFGKTRTGAEWVTEQARNGNCGRLALVAPTAGDARDVMVEGESGIVAIAPPGFRPLYEPSKRRITWPNGAQATLYSADEPDRLRGPQHDGAWADELASWNRLKEAWDNLMFGLRLGLAPRAVVTTTPRPLPMLKTLRDLASTAVTAGSTYENEANLSPAFMEDIRRQYEGTRIGRQELHAEILDDIPGALWNHAGIDRDRRDTLPDMARVVAGIDPAVTSGEDSDETGIIGAGKGVDGDYYVFADASCRLSPDGWARRAVNVYHEHNADRLIAEANNGGEMVALTIRTVDSRVPVKLVHASRGKRTRAEPIAALYEQGRVHHVGGLPTLEDQMCSFAPDSYDGSPDRVDALVWALTELSEPRKRLTAL